MEQADADWFKKRHSTSWICIVYAFAIGMEYSCISTSLLYYLKEDLKLENPKLWYSVIMSLTAASASINAVISGKLFDKTRRLKLFMLIFTMVTLVGNLLYTLQISVWFLAVGRFFCGLCDAAQPVISGEFSRLFKGQELTKKLSQYQALYAVGFVMGPACPVLFGKINIQITEWLVLNQNNFVSIFMALVMLGMIPAITVGVHDLGKKEDICNREPEHSMNNFTAKDIVMNFDLILLIISSALVNAIASIVELNINLMASDWYQWSLDRLSITTFVCVFVYIVFMLTVAYKIIDTHLKLIFLLVFLLHAMCVLILMLPKLYPIYNIYWQEIQMVVSILLNSVTGLTIAVLARALLFQMVPPDHASFSDGFRSTVTRVFSVLAFFAASWIYENTIYVSPVIAFVMISTFFILVSRRIYRPCT